MAAYNWAANVCKLHLESIRDRLARPGGMSHEEMESMMKEPGMDGVGETEQS